MTKKILLSLNFILISDKEIEPRDVPTLTGEEMIAFTKEKGYYDFLSKYLISNYEN